MQILPLEESVLKAMSYLVKTNPKQFQIIQRNNRTVFQQFQDVHMGLDIGARMWVDVLEVDYKRNAMFQVEEIQ